MGKGRLEAFSDGVFAIIITIMVLELKVPHGAGWQDLAPLLPIFLSYVLSFIFVGIYWNNHHHMLHAAKRVNGAVLWANLHILFWLSLIPFVAGWMGENHFASLPTAAYGAVMLMAAVAYSLLQRAIMAVEGDQSLLRRVVGRDRKGLASRALLIASIPVAFAEQWIAQAIFVVIALMWLIPDRRIERALGE